MSQDPNQPIEKFCPFMSTGSKQVSCSQNCKLYRPNRQGYECTLSEIQAISWNTRQQGQANNQQHAHGNQYPQ